VGPQINKMNYKKIIWWIEVVVIALVIFAVGVWFGSVRFAYHVPQPGNMDFSLFWDAYNKLQDNFISPEKIDNQKVIYGAISGMTNSLGDPYTEFFDPDHAKKFNQDLAGSFEGIGVEIGMKKDLLVIIAPLKGTPGEKAGLKAGDIILEIDGKSTNNLTSDEAVGLIRGQKGTTVTLTISREGWQSTKEIKIVRDKIKVPSIEWSLKNGDVAYIQMYQFDQTLTDDFRAMALEIKKSPARKIVLDLRNNPGGYLDVAQNVAGWFLQNGQIVTVEDFGETTPKNEYKAEGNAELINYPIVVLINEGSASASEILAGALRDNRGVKLIGMKSFGKGSVQQVVDMIDGSFLKITVAHWLTPKGNFISEVGLTPDIKIEITDQDIKDKKDSQLDKALEIVQGLK